MVKRKRKADHSQSNMTESLRPANASAAITHMLKKDIILAATAHRFMLWPIYGMPRSFQPCRYFAKAAIW